MRGARRNPFRRWSPFVALLAIAGTVLVFEVPAGALAALPPTSASASVSGTTATVTFTPDPLSTPAATSFTATCTSGNGGTTRSGAGAGSPISVATLTRGATYTCTVTATNTDGTSGPSPASNSFAVPAVAPSAPTNPNATAGNGQATVNFSAPTDDGGAAITTYSITSSPAGGSGSRTTPGSVVIGGLTNGQSYTFTITATNSAGTGPGATTGPVTPASGPGAPGGVSVSLVGPGTTARVSFTPGSTGGLTVTFGVSCDTATPGGGRSASGGSSPIDVASLVRGSTYTCTVTAQNTLGTASAVSESFVVPALAPGAPTNVTAVAGDASATVSFGAPASDGGSPITHYDVTSTPAGGTAPPRTTPGSFNVTGLTNGVSYTFTVTATNSVTTGPGATSNAVTPARAPHAFAAAPIVLLQGADSNTAQVSFVSDTGTGLPVTYTATCTGPGATTRTATGGGSPIDVTGLSFGRNYSCTIRAANSLGNTTSGASNTVGVPTRVPFVPTSPFLGAFNVSGSADPTVADTVSATVSWGAPEDGGTAITAYDVQCTSGNGGAGLSALGVGGTSIGLVGFSKGKSYSCTVVARNAVGSSDGGVTNTRGVPTTPPKQPSIASVTPAPSRVVISVALSDDGGQSTAFDVTCASSGQPVGAATVIGGTGTTGITVNNLANAHTYNCTISTGNATGSAPDVSTGAFTPFEVPLGYWLVTDQGNIARFPDQNVEFFGGITFPISQPIVAMEVTPTSKGYWLVARDGGIFGFGDAGFYGSTGGIALNQPIVGMASTPSGQGYWLVAADGGVFSYGDAAFFGSTGDIQLNQPIVGLTSTASGRGYWLVARDGGVFAFGDAVFMGSTGNIQLNQPIVGMAATRLGTGYWMVASDGGIFSFGDAGFFGSTGAIALQQPIVGMSASPANGGYWLVASDGGVFSFGEAPYYGTLAGTGFRIVGMGSSRLEG